MGNANAQGDVAAALREMYFYYYFMFVSTPFLLLNSSYYLFYFFLFFIIIWSSRKNYGLLLGDILRWCVHATELFFGVRVIISIK